MNEEALTIAEVHPACTVLGPGSRFVVWVQGCSLGCVECVSPQWIPFEGGRKVQIRGLARRIVDEAVDGLTISGGEPFAQAAGLSRLVELIRSRRDLSVLSYTGYTLEHLRAHGTAAQRRLLDQLDLLIDGPYVAHRHADLRWRGSANQRIHHLSARHAERARDDDQSQGLQFEVDPVGAFHWLGVPPVRGFRADLERALGVLPVAEVGKGGP